MRYEMLLVCFSRSEKAYQLEQLSTRYPASTLCGTKSFCITWGAWFEEQDLSSRIFSRSNYLTSLAFSGTRCNMRLQQGWTGFQTNQGRVFNLSFSMVRQEIRRQEMLRQDTSVMLLRPVMGDQVSKWNILMALWEMKPLLVNHLAVKVIKMASLV